MRPFILAIGIITSTFLLSSCVVATVSPVVPAYSPGYTSVGIYTYPSWGYGGYYPGGLGYFGGPGYYGGFGGFGMGFGGPGFGFW
jgi:hypothetical protein